MKRSKRQILITTFLIAVGSGLMAYPFVSNYLYEHRQQQEQGVGHLENTSLPVGGESTHCVLSAHTGLSDKKLFTDLVLLEKGDTFYIHTLDQILAYEVDQILTVKPEDTSQLKIVPEKDYVTMVTCTPYGVNSHRLLVRGYRIPYRPEEGKQALKKTTSSPWMRQYLFSILIGILVLILIMAGVCWHIRRSGPKGRNKS